MAPANSQVLGWSYTVILRGVIYTEQPRPLKSIEVVVAKPSVTVVNASALATAQASVANMEVAQQELSLQRVMAWLVLQNEAVWMEIARKLDDDIAQVRAEAVIEGRVAGAAAANADIKMQCSSAIEALRTMTNKSEQLFNQRYENVVQQCANIVGEALSKLVGPAIADPQACIFAVREAVGYVRGARDLTIRVNSQDEHLINSYKSEIAEILGHDDLSIVADARVTSGGCLIESSFGDIDARWETKLRSLVGAIRSANVDSFAPGEQS